MDMYLIKKISLASRIAVTSVLAIGAMASFTVPAHAGPVSVFNTYDVTGVFEDGGLLSGFFQYDPTTSAFGTFNIDTTATTNTSVDDSYSGTSNVFFAGYDYINGDATPSGNGVSDHVQFDTTIGGLGLPGELAYLPTSPGIDDNLAYSTGATEWNQQGGRGLSSGYLSLAGAPVPEVSSVMFLAVLGLLSVPCVLMSRKRTQTAA